MTKGKYAEMMNLIPHEGMQILKDEADEERLVGIFGETEQVLSQTDLSGATWIEELICADESIGVCK